MVEAQICSEFSISTTTTVDRERRHGMRSLTIEENMTTKRRRY
jgi:hypothetical protein